MKNKGYYGWIHSLNEAGIQAQRNGFEILAEQRAHKAEMLNEAKKPNRGEESTAKQKEYLKNYSITRAAKKKAADAAKAAVIAANPNGIDDQSDLQIDGLHDMAAIIKAEGMKMGSGVERPESGYHNDNDFDPNDPHAGTEELPNGELPRESEIGRLARAETARLSIPAGNANAVAQDGADGVMDGPLPTRVHPDAWYDSPERASWETAKLNGYEDETDAAREDKNLRRLTVPRRGSFTGPVTESVSQKISRIMNEGNKTVRGRIVTGGDSEIPARSPNSLDAPDGIFKGTESPSQKVGRILQIVNDGPEKHGEEIHSWASNALNTMQKRLRRN